MNIEDKQSRDSTASARMRTHEYAARAQDVRKARRRDAEHSAKGEGRRNITTQGTS